MSNVKGRVLPVYSKIKSNLRQLQSVQHDSNRDNSQELPMLQVIATKLEGLEKQLGDIKQEQHNRNDQVMNRNRAEKEKRQKKAQMRLEEDKKRKREDKKLKAMMKEFSLLKEEYCKMVKILKTNNSMLQQGEANLKRKKAKKNKNKMKAVVTNNKVPAQQSISKPKAFETIVIPSVPSAPSRKKAKTNEMVDVTNRYCNSYVVEQSSQVQQSKGQRINEGASCSGVSTNKGSESSDAKASKQNVTSGKSLNSGSNAKLEDLLKNEFRCSICHELYINPIGLACSHIFCSFCIEQWRINNAKCPICDIKIFEMSPQHFLTNVVGKIVNIMDEESKKRRSEVVKKRSDHYLQKHDFKRI